jgi:predicted nucleic acid-binding protein
VSDFVVDTSVLARRDQPRVNGLLAAIGWRSLQVTTVTLLEMGVSARGGADYQARMAILRRSFTVVAPSPWAHERALAVQELLALRGQHRSARLADLLIAATAEQVGAAVLHYDRDFDTVAAVTGQPCEWIVAAGSLDRL